MAVNPLNVTKTVAPNTLESMNVDEGLALKIINKRIRMETVLDDIFGDLGADVVGTRENVVVPNAIFLKLDKEVERGARQVTVPLLMALTGDPTIGPLTPIGNEKKQELKYCTFYYEEYSYAVASENFGRNANDMSMYGVFEKIIPQITTYIKELRGERIREALLETHCSVLTGAATPIQSVHFNKNWYVPNTVLGSQPSYKKVYGQDQDYTNGTGTGFVENIADALEAAATGVGTEGEDANISLNYLRSLAYYATNYLRIDPIFLSGKKTYIVLVPSTQKFRLTTNEPGQLGDIYTGMVRATKDEMAYAGVLGRVDELLLVEDQRYPTITVGGANGSWTITPKYVKPGNTDNRNKAVHHTTSNKSWDIGFLLGKGAVCEWVKRDLHFEYEVQHYTRDKGTGVFGESGISLVQYDIDSGDSSDTTKENYGSIVLPFTTPSITA